MYVYIFQIDNFHLIVIITECLPKEKKNKILNILLLLLLFSKTCQRKILAAAQIYFWCLILQEEINNLSSKTIYWTTMFAACIFLKSML